MSNCVDPKQNLNRETAVRRVRWAAPPCQRSPTTLVPIPVLPLTTPSSPFCGSKPPRQPPRTRADTRDAAAASMERTAPPRHARSAEQGLTSPAYFDQAKADSAKESPRGSETVLNELLKRFVVRQVRCSETAAGPERDRAGAPHQLRSWRPAPWLALRLAAMPDYFLSIFRSQT